MEGLVIQIDWAYFLGVMAALLGIAWYSNGRFTKLETSMDWLEELVRDIKIQQDNALSGLYAAHSPVNLTDKGNDLLNDSGLRAHIDTHKRELLAAAGVEGLANPYQIQTQLFGHIDAVGFGSEFEDKLKAFAFERGLSLPLMRRVGAIYLRNVHMHDAGIALSSIDEHEKAQVGIESGGGTR